MIYRISIYDNGSFYYDDDNGSMTKYRYIYVDNTKTYYSTDECSSSEVMSPSLILYIEMDEFEYAHYN